MRIETVNIYTYDELDPRAQDRARDEYRTHMDFDSSCTLEDFEQICGLIGITLKRHEVPLMSGRTRNAPNIWFSGFASQGDGASFEGTYTYAKRCKAKIRAYAPQDEKLHAIVDDLAEIQRRYFYRLGVDVESGSSMYYHSGAMRCDVWRKDGHPMPDDDTLICSVLRRLADWLYARLDDEYRYQTSDEEVAEMMRCNEYEFTANGKHHT